MNKVVIVLLISLVVGCSDKNIGVENINKPLIIDRISEYKEVCLNGIVYYESRSVGTYKALAPKIVTQHGAKHYFSYQEC